MFALTRKGKAFIWDEECQGEFEYLKPVLTTTLILDLPQDEGTYVPDSDACDEGIGPVLSQKINGAERVIFYGSRICPIPNEITV